MTDDTAIADPIVDEPEPALIAVETCPVELAEHDVRYGGELRAAMAGRDALAVAGRRPGDTFQRMNDDSAARRRPLRAG